MLIPDILYTNTVNITDGRWVLLYDNKFVQMFNGKYTFAWDISSDGVIDGRIYTEDMQEYIHAQISMVIPMITTDIKSYALIPPNIYKYFGSMKFDEERVEGTVLVLFEHGGLRFADYSIQSNKRYKQHTIVCNTITFIGKYNDTMQKSLKSFSGILRQGYEEYGN